MKNDLYGVSFANLKMLAKKLKSDNALAVQLWESDNHDARILATMIADPASIEEGILDGWVKALDNYDVTDAFSDMVARTAHARDKMEAWTSSDEEFIGAAGWQILAHLAMSDGELDDAFFEKYLHAIEKTIYRGKNRTKYSMNSALIAIGIRNELLQKKATAAAQRIGRVDVDHGQTSCNTPNAAAYIHKASQRKTKRK